MAACSTPAGPRATALVLARAAAAARRRGRLPLAVWLFTLPALFSGTFDVLVPLRLDDLGASAVTIGAVFLVAAAIEAVLSPLLGRSPTAAGGCRRSASGWRARP